MDIPDLLWEVKEREGYGSIAEMARAKQMELGIPIPAGTLYSWMTKRERHRRTPYAAASLRIISRITGQPTDELLEMAERDARDTKEALAR